MSIDTIYEGSCVREQDTVINKDDTDFSNSSICMICMIDRVDEIEHISKCRCTIKHLYCRSCIYGWYRTTRRLSCPVCRFGDIMVDQFTQTSEHGRHNQIIKEGTVIVYDDDVLNNRYDNQYDDQIDLHDTILFDDITLGEVVGFISSSVTSTLTSLFNTVENSLIYSLLKLWHALYRQTFQERTHSSRQRLEFFKVFKTTVHLLSMLLIRFVLSVTQYYIDAF